ncbi:ataxin-7-like protein 3 isoform X3 [Lissotriton helveticus]
MKMEEMSLSGLDNSKLEAIAHEIYTELIEDSCLGLCFEAHRAAKCGYFFLDDTDPGSMKDFEIVDQPGVDIFGQVYNQWKNKECVCPNCNRSIAASRFAPHLEKCLGMGRNSSRIANRRIASSNNMNKSESDQEDNDDVNDNDWSYGSEKKATTKKRKPEKQCGVISEHTKKMCTRSLRCPQHTDEQRRSVRVYLMGNSDLLTDVEGGPEIESFDVSESQALMSRLQWDGSSDISPSDSASSKASTNNSETRKSKKKKPNHMSLVSGGGGSSGGGGAGGGGGGGGGGSSSSTLSMSSSKKKKPKPLTPSIYDDMN